MFQKNSGSEKFMEMREREVSRFPSKIFCLTLSKSAVGEISSLSLVSGIEKVWMRYWGGECQDFPSKIFCLTVPKNFAGGHLRQSLILGIEKIFASDGYVTILRQKFFVSQHRNIS